MDDLVAFLRARITEDEAIANQAFAEHNDAASEWSEIWSGVVQLGIYEDLILTHDRAVSCHIVRHDPARVLAEVDAKRELVDEHHPVDPCDAHDAALASMECPTLRALALPYADHPDYDESWLP